MEQFQIQDYKDVLVIVIVLLLESWLGKTNRTKAGSILELIINVATALSSRLKKKE